MEKEKKTSSFRRLGKFFKNRTADHEKGNNEVLQEGAKQPVEDQNGPGNCPSPTTDLSASAEPSAQGNVSSETKRKTFGSWRQKRKSLPSVSTSPPNSPGPSDCRDRSYDTPDVDQDLRPFAITTSSTEDPDIISSNLKEPPTNGPENVDKSRSPSSESPKKDSTKKPVLGKFGNLFNASKKKPVKGIGESSTSPTNDKTITYKSTEKDIARERKRVQVSVTSSSKVQTQASCTVNVEAVSEQLPQHTSKESAVAVAQSEKECTNGNIDTGLAAENKESDSLVKEVVESSNVIAESPVLPAETVSDTSQKSTPSTTPKVERQSSIDKSVRIQTQSPARRSSADEANRFSVRRLQVFSPESSAAKEESPKLVSRKTAKFSSKVVDTKLRIQEKPLHKLDSTEKTTSKITVHVASHSDSQDQEPLTADLNVSSDTADGLAKPVRVGDSPAALSPLERDTFGESEHEKLKDPSSNESTINAKVLAFDIYLSKTAGTNSPTRARAWSNGETMEKSPNNKKTTKKRRSLKSQSSQNDEKRAEKTPLQDNVFEYNFEGVREYSTPDSNIKPAPLSPEPNGTVLANQELKAGAKLSPKGDSDKDKQQHPASSPARKKNQSAWAPYSPTARKAQARDPLFRNQTVAASAKASEVNQPVPVSTTKDAYVEKASGSESLTGCSWENSCDTAGDSSPAAVGIPSQDRRAKQKQHSQGSADLDSPTQTPDLRTSKPQTAHNDHSKSTVTSKLNIPPKPKNVELPIRPKVIDNLDEPTNEAYIPKGNIASKVSLFENKRASHRIDIYATKNISQPKKFVERAKLNIGKQVKGTSLKDNTAVVKSFDFSVTDGKKPENGHCEIKADTIQESCANGKADYKAKEKNSVTLTNQKQMEDNKNGLDVEVTSLSPQKETISSSVEDKIPKDQPEALFNSDFPLNENVTTQSDLLVNNNKEETLSHSSLDSSDTSVGNITPLESDVGFTLDSTNEDMGNGHNTIKKEPVSVEEPNDDLSHAFKSLNHVDSALIVKKPTEHEHTSLADIERDSKEPPSEEKGPSKSPERRPNKKKTQPKEPAESDCKKEKKVIQCTSDSKSEETSSLAKNEDLNAAIQVQPTQITKAEEVQSREDVKESYLFQNGSENEPHSPTPQENLPAAESLPVDEITQAVQEEPICGVNNVSHKSTVCTNETSNEPEEDSPSSEPVSLSQQSEDFSQQNDISAESSKKDQFILGGDISANEISSVDLKNIDKHVPCPEGVKENGSQSTTGESELTTAHNESLPNALELSVAENNESDKHGASMDAEPVSEEPKNNESLPKNVLCEGDQKEAYFNTDVSNNDVHWNEDESVIPDSSVLENGFLVDSGTITYTNGSLQHTDVPEDPSTNIQRSPESSFNASVLSEESILDSSSDMEKFAETIRKLDSPVTVPQKRKKPRAPKSPGPYYGLPPIREDYLEKILDTESFSFGLGKKDRTKDLAPMALFKMQSKETAEKMKPKRASAEQSMILKSLRSQKEPLAIPQEACDKEKADVADLAVKRSRIESFYSSLKTPLTTKNEGNVFSPTVTTVSTITTSFDTPRTGSIPQGQTCDLKTTDSADTAHTSVKEGALTQQSSANSQNNFAKQFTPVKDMDNHLEITAKANSNLPITQPPFSGLPDVNHCVPDGIGDILPFESTPKSDHAAKDVSEIFYFKGKDQTSLMPNLSSEVLPVAGAQKVNPRPGKVVILSQAEYGGAVFEVFTDVMDCTSWELSPTIFIKTIRGCWILYELPNFEGRTIPLEEGDMEVTNPWGEGPDENSDSPVVIGSLRHVVKDYRICQIDLFTDPDGLGIMNSYFDDTEELQVYGRLQRTCSIKVHCGVWLIYEESGFQGVPFILEPREYADLSFWNTQEAYIGSLRPLKMGSRKVEIPYEPKIVIFEKPMFEGRQIELEREMLTFGNLEGNGEEPMTTIGSMRVLSGLWVGFEKPEFEGHQYLLEEGDYEEWSQWGGYNGLLQSLRPILSDFSTPHMTMYSEKDCDEKAPNINVLGIISNMEETGYGVKTQSINVLSGVWVAYEYPDFTGEQYILEKGLYSNFSDWGAKHWKISSVQPVVMETIEIPGGTFKVEVFSETDFQGQSVLYTEDTNSIEEGFKVMSCKVTAGRWVAYDKVDYSGNLWVLEEGNFPNLCAMGCPNDTSFRSLKIINYEFSEPNLVLFGKENCRGRRVILNNETTNLQALGYSTDLQSLEVLGGMWVFYEYSHYRGQQLLISPGKIAQWQQFSGWDQIGSLRPLRQRRLYFKLRNKSNGMLMSTNGSLDDINLLRIQVMEDTGAEDQIWVYHKGVFRCRIAEDCILANAGTLITAGSKLSLSLEQSGTSLLWNVKPDGRIYSSTKPNLVLDIKGGNQYDQQHVVLNPVTEGKVSQLWEICVL